MKERATSPKTEGSDFVDYAAGVIKMHLAQIAGLFRGGRCTFVWRMPGANDRYLIVGHDPEVTKVVERWIKKGEKK